MNTSEPNPSEGNDKPNAESVEGRRQIVAMQALTRAITGPLAQAVIENTKTYALAAADPAPAAAPAAAKKGKRKDKDAEAADEPAKRKRPEAGRPDAVAAVRALLAAGKDSPDDPNAKDKEKGKPKTPPPNKELGLLGKSAGALSGTFFRLLGPLGTLAGLLGSSASGMQTLGKASELLAMVFAPLLLPVTLLLATAMIALSEVLFSSGLPALKMWFGLMKYGIMYLQVWIDKIQVLAILFEKLSNWIRKIVGADDKDKKQAKKVADDANAAYRHFRAPGKDEDPQLVRERAAAAFKLRQNADEDFKAGKITKEEHDAISRMESSIYKVFKEEENLARDMLLQPQNHGGRGPTFRDDAPGKAQAPDMAGAPKGAPGEGGQGADRPIPGKPNIKGILDEVMQSFRMSFAPKANFSGLLQTKESATLAAANQDPIERRILTQLENIAGLIQDGITDNNRPKAQPDRGNN